MTDIGLRGVKSGSVASAKVDQDAQPIATGSSSGFLHFIWHRRSVRWQILVAFALINLIAGIGAVTMVTYNAKRAADLEIRASIDVAERFVRASISQLQQTLPSQLFLEDLVLYLGRQRHVRMVVTTITDRPFWLAKPLTSPTGHPRRQAPDWFASLIQVGEFSREVPVMSNGRQIGWVRILGAPADEIEEAWADVSGLAVIAFFVNIAVIALLYLVLGRVLKPLSAVADGLHELEQGRFRHRLTPPKVRELAFIVQRFNVLADSLGVAKDDNIRLNHRLITAQEDERRQIAMELHDELGPCLFGLKANLASAKLHAAKLPSDVGSQIQERIETLTEIGDRIQTLNRSLLRRIRPMALGNVPLSEALAGLATEFEQHASGTRFIRKIGPLADSYGDGVDLTLYRCMQEGLTNAVKHADARRIEIDVAEETPPAGGLKSDAASELKLAIRDDGIGIGAEPLPGMGLTGIMERVEALGGSYAISGRQGPGTELVVTIPLGLQESSLNGKESAEGAR